MHQILTRRKLISLGRKRQEREREREIGQERILIYFSSVYRSWLSNQIPTGRKVAENRSRMSSEIKAANQFNVEEKSLLDRSKSSNHFGFSRLPGQFYQERRLVATTNDAVR